ETLGGAILAAMKTVLKKWWKVAKDYAEMESKKLAQTLVSIEAMALTNSIKQDQAELLLDMEKHAARSVLLTIEGIGLIAAQQAIDAGLQVVAQSVNKAVGFALI